MWLWIVVGFYLGGLIVPMVSAGLPSTLRPRPRTKQVGPVRT
jgi:hypothetical protein